ncbi:MAG: hypothetical protein KUG71_04420 [Porticoccaceae bacterium]|nr:hypothetical protein [Porticoccaceae bacterium]
MDDAVVWDMATYGASAHLSTQNTHQQARVSFLGGFDDLLVLPIKSEYCDQNNELVRE